MSWVHWLGCVVALLAMYGALHGFDELEHWADRRRHARRTAQARRIRARRLHEEQRRAISAREFRAQVEPLLAELEQNDQVRALVASIEYVARASSDGGEAA